MKFVLFLVGIGVEEGLLGSAGCGAVGTDKGLGFGPGVKLLELGPLPAHYRFLGCRPLCVDARLAADSDAVEAGRLVVGRGGRWVAAGGEG